MSIGFHSPKCQSMRNIMSWPNFVERNIFQMYWPWLWPWLILATKLSRLPMPIQRIVSGMNNNYTFIYNKHTFLRVFFSGRRDLPFFLYRIFSYRTDSGDTQISGGCDCFQVFCFSRKILSFQWKIKRNCGRLSYGHVWNSQKTVFYISKRSEFTD